MLKRAIGKVKDAIIVAVVAVLAAVTQVQAASGISKVDTLLEKISTALLGIGVVVITIALMWGGYKLAFAHASKEEIAKPVLGGLLVGSASAIAGWLMQ